MSILLNCKYKKLGMWMIWGGLATTIITTIYGCTIGDCCDPDYIGVRDYGWIIMSLGIILYIVSKDKINDEYLNELKIKAGGIVFILTVVIAAILDFINSNYSPSLDELILFQFIGYYILYKSLTAIEFNEEQVKSI